MAGIEEISTPVNRLSVLGTQHYIAPEYLLGQPASYLSDAFSLGIITYEMITGKLPFGENYGKKAFSKLKYISMLDINTDVPLWVDGAVRKIVKRKPTNRYEEISEFIHDLSYPNKELTEKAYKPLMERNPTAFWKGLSFLSLIANIFLVFFR